MAITNAQQYQQLLAQGGRIGFFKGAQADASAGKGSMSPGTSGTGGQRGGGNGKGRDLDFQQRGMSKKDYDATKGDRDQNFGGRQNIFEKAFDTAKDFLPGGKYSLTGIAARGLRNIFGGPKSFEEKYGYATDYQGTTGPSKVKDFGFDSGNGRDDRPIIPIIPPLETTPKEESTDVVTSAPRIAYRLMNEGGMADDRMPYEGGIMDLESARQMYGLGKLVRKVTKTVKKIAKSPIGKAALIGAAAFGIPGTSIGGLFGRASFGKAATGLFGQQGLGATLAAGKAKFLSQGLPNLAKGQIGVDKFGNAIYNRAGGSSLLDMIGGKVGAGILGASALAGLMTPKAEEEEQAELNPYLGEGLDIADIRSRPRFYQGQAYRLMSNGGDTEDAKTEEPDLSKDPNYKGWVKIYETNPDLAEMNENHSKYLQFYNKKAEGGSMKEPVAKKTMPLLDLEGQEMDFRQDGGFVPIGRMEKADDVPARLSKNEFVFTAEAVRNAGDGDVDKGAEVMYNMMKNLESGGDVSEESQGLEGARKMFQTSQRLEEVL